MGRFSVFVTLCNTKRNLVAGARFELTTFRL
jgi:hypothetical protein